jgi:preprotein translocase SecF subunit
MFRLFHDNNINFLGHKAVFMSVSVVLMLVGCAGVIFRGFNLGVDFAGGTLVYARFVKPPTTDEIRDALTKEGVEGDKVIIQPIAGGTGSTGLLIRLPENAAGEAGGIGAEKRSILKALSGFSPAEGTVPGKSNLNTADASEIATELRRPEYNLDAAVNAEDASQKLVAFRDAKPTGMFDSIDEVKSVPDLPPGFVDALQTAYFAGKVDINSIGGDDLLSTLKRLDPLGIKADQAASDAQYAQLRDAIITYRDKTRDGVVTSIEEIPLDAVPADAKSKIAQNFVLGNFNIVNAEAVGAQVGNDLRNRAIYVTLASLVGMLIYIAFRFEWIYGVGAVLAVFHDAMICLGLFALFQWEINLTVVAALLTLVGYSTNDTIVIFDRIRENLRTRRRDSLESVTNDAINQTLSRTVIATGTAFLTVLVLVLFGGDVLKSFSLVLLLGIVIGTYSSIGIASPIMLWWQLRHRPQRTSVKSDVGRSAQQAGARVART